MSYDYETPLWEQYENEQNIKKQEQQAEPASILSAQEAEQMGIIQPAEKAEQDKIENPELNQDNNPQYKKLSVGDTMKDIGTAVGVEALHFLQPKSMETQYQSQTRVGETLKQVYRWGIGFVGLGKVGWGIKAITAIPKIANAGRIGAVISKGGAVTSKLLGNEALIKTGSSNFLKKFGVGLANVATQGAAGGAILDWNLNNLDDPHIADMFGATDNKLVQLLQSDPDDSNWQIRAKNVVEGAFINMGINGIGKAFTPLLKKSIKGIRALKAAKTEKEVEELLPQLLKDELQIDEMASKADLLAKTKEVYNQAIKDNSDGEEVLKEIFSLNDLPEAKDIYKKLAEGEDFTMLPDGTLSIKVSNWEDAHKVTSEQYSAQLEPIEAIEHQNEAVKSTWQQRNLLEIKDGTLFNASSKQPIVKGNQNTKNILNYYKDEWGLGKAKIDIQFGFWKEVNEGKTSGDKNKILIQIDKNAPNPYATLRSELEHARDIVKGEVPKGAELKGSGVHFSRYKGDNEGEVASIYTHKKSVGKYNKTQVENSLNEIEANIKQYEFEGLKYKEAEPDGFGDNRTELNDKEGNSLGFIEYSLKDNIVSIDEIQNTTKRAVDVKTGNKIAKETGVSSVPDVGEKLIDKIITDNPDKQILWDAVTPDGISFKNQYLAKHPKLKDKIVGITNPNELDQEGLEAYNSMVKTRGEDATGNTSRYDGSNAREAQGNINTNNTKKSRRVEASTSKQMGSGDRAVVSSNNQGDTRRGVTDTDTSFEQLDLSTKIEAKQTSDEIVEGIANGELKIKSLEDVETVIQGIIRTDTAIKDNTFKSLAEAADTLADSMFADDKNFVKNIKKAIAANDPKQVKAILTRAVALERVVPELLEKINNKNLSPAEHLETLETLGLIQTSNKETASTAGGFLGAMNFLKEVNNVFSNGSLTSLSKEGITNLVDVLDREIKKIISLDFTYEQGSKALIKSLINNPNPAYKELLMSNSKLAYELKNVFDSALKAGKKLDRAKLEETMLAAVVSHDVKKVIDNMRRATDNKGAWRNLSNGIKTYYITNLLSGFGTPFKNACSGLMNTMVYPCEKVLAGALWGGGKELMNEGIYTYKGMVKSMAEAYNLMSQAWIKGEGSLAQIGQTLEGTNVESWMKPFQEGNGGWTKIRNGYTLMSRAMMATDEFVKQLNYRSIARGKSYAQALKAKEHNMIGDSTVDDFAEEILKSRFYDADGAVIDKDVLYEANQITYQTNLDGKMIDPKTGDNVQMRDQTLVMQGLNHLNNAANKFLPLKIMFPFLRTGTNILQTNLDHNFAYEFGADAYRFLTKEQELKLFGKGKEAAMTRARCAFGFTSLIPAVIGIASIGLITGSPPTDKKERAALFKTGWKPYSINMGGKWISYQGYEPVQTWLGFAADSYRMVTETVDAEKDAKMITFMNHLGQTITNNLIDKAAFRTGISQLNWLFNPDTLRRDGILKVVGQMGSGFLPTSGLIKNINSAGAREITQPTGYERIYNMYRNRGLGDYRRDVFGNRQDIFGVLVTTASNNKYDMPEYEELARLGMNGFQAPEIGDNIANYMIKVKEFKHPQTDKSVYDYMQDKLSTVRLGGKTLQESVRELVQDPYYQQLIDGTENLQVNESAKKVDYTEIGDTKASMLKDLFIEYNNYAKEEALFDCGDYVNTKGQNIEAIQQQIIFNTQSKMINQNLNNTVQKINNLF